MPSNLDAHRSEPRWKTYGCLLLMLIGLYLAMGPRVKLSEWKVTREGNTALDEAIQWKRGELTLSRDFYEDVNVGDKTYNVVGPAFVLLSLLGTTLSAWAGGGTAHFDPFLYVCFVALPLPLVGFWAFQKVVKSSDWSAVLTGYLIAGTSLAPVLAICRGGSIYYINHVLAVIGLLLIAADLLGPCRIWPAVIGLCIATWSRQTACFYALPILWIAWQSSGTPPPMRSPQTQEVLRHAPHRAKRRFWIALGGIAIAATLPMTLNALKFGNPFQTGYSLMYQDRTDRIGRKAQECFLGPRYLPEHAIAMNLAYPQWDVRKGQLHADIADTNGGSIWFTSPLLCGIFFTVPSWWHDRRRRALMLATLPVIAVFMCYHTTGADRAGYYRYALDFIPIWLMVIAPYTSSRRGHPLTLACLGYSALYFNLIPY